MPVWVMARLIGGPADGRFVPIQTDDSSETYYVAVELRSRIPATGETVSLGYLIAKYRYSRLSETEHDGSIPIMLYGFVKLEK